MWWQATPRERASYAMLDLLDRSLDIDVRRVDAGVCFLPAS